MKKKRNARSVYKWLSLTLGVVMSLTLSNVFVAKADAPGGMVSEQASELLNEETLTDNKVQPDENTQTDSEAQAAENVQTDDENQKTGTTQKDGEKVSKEDQKGAPTNTRNDDDEYKNSPKVTEFESEGKQYKKIKLPFNNYDDIKINYTYNGIGKGDLIQFNVVDKNNKALKDPESTNPPGQLISRNYNEGEAGYYKSTFGLYKYGDIIVTRRILFLNIIGLQLSKRKGVSLSIILMRLQRKKVRML